MINLRKLVQSFSYAWRGVKLVFKEEQNFRLQIAIALICLVLMIVFSLRSWEIIALILVITLVLVLELMNSIIERLVDILKPRVHFYVESIKDMMAAAVLISSLAAIIIGFKIFFPYFLLIFNS